MKSLEEIVEMQENYVAELWTKSGVAPNQNPLGHEIERLFRMYMAVEEFQWGHSAEQGKTVADHPREQADKSGT